MFGGFGQKFAVLAFGHSITSGGVGFRGHCLLSGWYETELYLINQSVR
jgi:hypothetical protein